MAAGKKNTSNFLNKNELNAVNLLKRKNLLKNYLHFFLDFFVDSRNPEKNSWSNFLQGGNERSLQCVFVGKVNGSTCKQFQFEAKMLLSLLQMQSNNPLKLLGGSEG
jgi:hypothetical protein